MTNEYCNTFWELFDLYCRLQDDHKLDPQAIVRARKAVDKHRRECAECRRYNATLPVVTGE